MMVPLDSFRYRRYGLEYKGKPTTPKGGVGFGVRTLDRLVWDWEGL